jgi:hypothetical protein
MVGLAMDEALIKVTFHSLANRVQFKKNTDVIV